MERSLLTFIDSIVTGLFQLVKSQLYILDDAFFPYEMPKKRWDELTPDERVLSTLKNWRWRSAFEQRMDFLVKFAECAAQKKLESVVRHCLSMLEIILDKALSMPDAHRRTVASQSVLRRMVDAHERSIATDVDGTSVIAGLFAYKIERLRPEDVDTLGLYLTGQYSEMAKKSIAKEHYETLWEWGTNCRHLVKDYPKITLMMIDILENGLASLKANPKPETRGDYAITRRDIESLKSWENHSHEEVSKRVTEILSKYPEKLE